jgi:predicted MPP superfamily phosphohydrolase
MYLLLKIIAYVSFLVFPLLIYLFWKLKERKDNFLAILLIVISLVFMWTRFIEPQIILVKKYEIQTGFSLNVAFVSDIHLGIYKNKKFLSRIVNKINNENPDLVLIGGDFIYFPNENLEKLFAPLKDIEAPVFAVLGNHDAYIENPQMPRVDLIDALQKNNIILLNNDTVNINNIVLVGIGSHMMKQDKVNILKKRKKEENVLVLTHNPDTTMFYPNDNVDYTLAGHTHGGQIKIPYLYKKVIPTIGNFDSGLYEKMLISSGAGETGLPMRFLCPPEIEVIHFY